jgi:hypothetical protein
MRTVEKKNCLWNSNRITRMMRIAELVKNIIIVDINDLRNNTELNFHLEFRLLTKYIYHGKRGFY